MARRFATGTLPRSSIMTMPWLMFSSVSDKARFEPDGPPPLLDPSGPEEEDDDRRARAAGEEARPHRVVLGEDLLVR